MYARFYREKDDPGFQMVFRVIRYIATLAKISLYRLLYFFGI